MRRFIIRSVIFFVLAGFVTVVVFWFVTMKVPSPEAMKEVIKDTAAELPGTIETQTDKTVETVSKSVPDEGVPLSTLALSEAQKNTLRAVSIDVDTFVITKSMIECGEAKLGEERIAAIVAKDAPSVLEVTKLIPCLTQ